jgi:hypothetical protein
MGDFGQSVDGRMLAAAGSIDDQPRLPTSPVDRGIPARPASMRASTGLLERGRDNISTPSRAPRRSRTTLWIAVAGALAYNSWPLAFVVNPSLAGSALASSFEGHSEPFSWLFILLDCVAGLCTATVCFRELRPRRGLLWPGGALVLALLAYGLFGMATAVDAVVPLDCGSASAQACASQIWPLTPDDMLTGAALFGLFVATVTIIVQMMRRPTALRLPASVGMALALVGWSVLGFIVLVWSTSATMAAVSQYAFLTLTSVLALAVPLEATAMHWRASANLSTAAVPRQSTVADRAEEIEHRVRHALVRFLTLLGEGRCFG